MVIVDTREYTSQQADVARLHDLLRTSRLSQKYYAHRLKSYKAWMLWMDILTALAASSAFVGLAFLQEFAGGAVVTGLVGTAALIAAIRPVLKMSDQIDRFSRLHYGWGKIHYELGDLLADIRRHDGVTASHQPTVVDISERFKALSLEDDPGPDRALVKKFQMEVSAEIPADRLWIPQS